MMRQARWFGRRPGASVFLLAAGLAVLLWSAPARAAADWEKLLGAADSLRREVRAARMQLSPRELLRAEQAYGGHLETAAAALALPGGARGALPARGAALVLHLVAARHPAALSYLDSCGARPGASGGGELRFMAGLRAVRRGNWTAAAELLAGGCSAPLQAYADWLCVQAWDAVDAERAGALALSLLRASPRHRFGDDLRLRAARHLLERGETRRAKELLAGHHARGSRAQTLLAEAYRREGRRRLFVEAFDRASRAGAVAGAEADLRRAQVVEILRARRLRSRERVADCMVSLARSGALALVAAAWGDHGRNLAPGDSLRVLRAYVDALYRARSAAALRTLGADLERGECIECRQVVDLALGRLARGRGDLPAMTRAFRAAAMWHDSLRAGTGACARRAATALWELGRELEDQRCWRDAAVAFGRLAARHPQDDHAAQARLRENLARFRAGERDAALAGLAADCRSAPARLVGGPCLWRALLGDRQEAAGYLAAGAAETAPGYYALRAAQDGTGGDSLFWGNLARQVRDPGDWLWPAAPGLWDSRALDQLLALIEGNPSVTAGVLMRAFGFSPWARALWVEMPGWQALSPGEQAAVLRALGDYQPAIARRLGSPVLRERYPAAHAAETARCAERFGFSAALLLAVMRQESLCDPAALSRAGASGLMQLMPATARRLADSLSLGAVDLAHPGDNLLLGAAHLEELFALTEGSLPMTLAAYNAGLTHARRWRAGWAGDWDSYIDSISYAETRRFVKSVLMHYWNILAAYGALGD